MAENCKSFVLKKISSTGLGVTAVTTNFDQLLEWALHGSVSYIDKAIYENTDFQKVIQNKKSNSIFKLHGCRSFPRTLGIQIDNVQELHPDKKEFMRQYLSLARPEGKFTRIFFIGYNFADPDVLKELKKDIDKQRIHPIVINPYKTKTIRSFIDCFEKSSCEATHIPFTFDFFMKLVDEILNTK